ncbi:MAG: OmpH family outer membrane protein [Phycisphaeraceae bacterium]|nr:OmpH family outer membrane protein [Phycisphaeraceae bacterium]
MKKIERLFIYSGVGVAIALGLGWRGLGTNASANVSATQADTVRIATADILTLVEKLASSDRYLPARDEKVKSLRAPIDLLQKELDDLRAKITAIPDFQNNAEAQPLIQQFQQKSQNMQALSQTAQNEAENFNTTQLQEAYRIVIETTTQIANSKGYTHVISTKLPDNRLTSNNVTGLLQEMLARPVVKAPAADDITEDVVKELKLEDVKSGPATGAAPSPAPATTGGSTAPR